MPISAAIGIGSAIFGAVADVGAAIGAGIADVGAGLAAADVGAGVAADVAGGAVAADVAGGAAAADIAGATALPEILVTPSVAGAEAAGGALTGGALTGAEAAGAGLLGAAPIAAAGGAEAAGLGLAGAGAGGVTSIPEIFGGATAPLAALTPSDVVGQDFGTLAAAGIGPSVDLTAPTINVAGGGGGIAGDLTSPLASDFAAIGGSAGDTGLPTDVTAFAPTTTDFSNPLANVTPGDTAFANAPAAVPGQAPSSLATTLLTEDPLTGGTPYAGVGVPSEIPDIPATIGPGTTPGAPLNLATAAPADIGSTIGPGAPVSPAAASLFSGSTLRTAAMLAPLGALGLTLARGQPSLPPAMQTALNNLGPAQGLASQQLQEGATGQITPAQTAQINQYKQNAKNQLYQLYASMGRNPAGDSDYIQGLATIDANAVAMQQQFIDSAIKNGLAAQGVVDSELNAAANLQVAQDQAFQSSLQSALQSFGLVAALNTATARPA